MNIKQFLKGLASLALILTCGITSSSEVGVATHFAQGKGSSTKFFQWAKSSGISSFRDELYWDQIETIPGEFKLSGNSLSTFLIFQSAKKNGLNPMLVLGYGNKYYDNGTQPYTEQGRAAFARYVNWIVPKLRGSVDYFEIWNEWNIGAGTSPRLRVGDPENYVLLVKAASEIIKKTNPDAKVIVGALGDDWNGFPWLRSALSKGLLQYADGVSVHLYNHCMSARKGGAEEIISRLSSLNDILMTSNKGRSIPIYLTELGWPTNSGQCSIPENVSGEQSLRILLESKSILNLAGMWWYEFMDGGSNDGEREHRFGLVRTNYEEKPSGCRLRSVVPFLQQATLIKSIKKDGVSAMIFAGADGRQLLSIWSGDGYIDTVSDVDLIGSLNKIKKFDIACDDRVTSGDIVISENKVSLKVSTYPKLFWISDPSSIIDIIKK